MKIVKGKVSTNLARSKGTKKGISGLKRRKGGLVLEERKLKKDVARIKKELQADDQWKQISASVSGVTYSGNVIGLNNFNDATYSSTGQGTREGMTQTNKSYANAFSIVTGSVPCTVRILIYWDKDNTSSTASDVLLLTGSAYSVISPIRRDVRDKYSILYDKVFHSDAYHPTVTERMFLDLKNKMTYYSGDQSTNINQNCLKMILLTDVSVNGATVAYSGELKYSM